MGSLELVLRPEPARASLGGFFALTLALSLFGLSACQKTPAANLPKLRIDQNRIALAGMSSGAYMATQVHLAFSDHLMGAGLVAGGPYGCSKGDLDTALGICMKGAPSAPDAAGLTSIAVERSATQQLAPIAGLNGDRVVIVHGALDQTVAPSVGQASFDFYKALARQPEAQDLRVSWDAERKFAHTFPTQSSGTDCTLSVAPYLGRCDFDAAGEIMREMFAAAATEVPASAATGELRTFSQDAYLTDGADAYLANTGYLYVPKVCAEPLAPACGLLIAFHGCEQNAGKVGEAFVRDAGFNRWADQLRVVVLYPQTRASYFPLNPKACWDWWGFSGKDFDIRSGVQPRWVARASAALGARLE
jgi:poly(3-hydroxybutyrate) depolymerase